MKSYQQLNKLTSSKLRIFYPGRFMYRLDASILSQANPGTFRGLLIEYRTKQVFLLKAR